MVKMNCIIGGNDVYYLHYLYKQKYTFYFPFIVHEYTWGRIKWIYFLNKIVSYCYLLFTFLWYTDNVCGIWIIKNVIKKLYRFRHVNSQMTLCCKSNNIEYISEKATHGTNDTASYLSERCYIISRLMTIFPIDDYFPDLWLLSRLMTIFTCYVYEWTYPLWFTRVN